MKVRNKEYELKVFYVVVLIITLLNNAMASESINLGTSLSLESEILDETRGYYVYLPPSYETDKSLYPTIYLLDGDINRFKGFVGVLEALSTATLGNQVQQAIVIALPNTDRSRDLTPSVLKQWRFKGRVLDTFEKTGNAKAFSLFIEKELIPKVESSFRTSGKRMLVGESFGGLFASYSLLHKQELFTDYLLIDPTAVWDDDYLNRTHDLAFKGVTVNSNVYFAFANNSHLGALGLANYEMGSEFAAKMIKQSSKQALAKQQYFANETHGTVAFLAWYHGLKQLLATKSG